MMRWTRVLVPLVILVATCAWVTSAARATDISPPTITASSPPVYTVGTAASFTFTETGTGTPVAYQYTVNDGPTQTVQAPSGTASVSIVPVSQHSRLIAYSVAADGTVSSGTVDDFFARAATPAADKDLNGDGRPDLLTVGNTAGLPAGLWQATGQPAVGKAAGSVAVPASDIGILGNGVSGAESPADFNGGQVITGRLTTTGFQDVLVYYPSGADAGGGVLLSGQGDGSALWPFSGGGETLTSGDLTDFNGDNPLQIANAYASDYGTGFPDLLAINGDPANGYYLGYYFSLGGTSFIQTFDATNVTPDGTADWNDWTMATLSDASGTGMFLWNKTTGALYLWEGVTAHDNGDFTGTLSFTQYLISPHWNKGKDLSTLEAADLNGDGVPDLWAVSPDGTVRAYLIFNLSAPGHAEMVPQEPQKLLP